MRTELNSTLQALREYMHEDVDRQLRNFQTAADREAARKKPPAMPDPMPRTGWLDLGAREKRTYSIFRGLTFKCMSRVVGEKAGSSLETELHDELVKRLGPPSRMDALLVPTDITHRAMDVSPASKGGYLVAESVGSLIDALRNVAVCFRLGAQLISGLQNNVSFPRLISGPSAVWLSGAAVSETSPTFGSAKVSPHPVLAYSETSEQLLRQADPVAERAVMASFGRSFGAEADRVMLNGAGGAEPLGLFNIPNVDASVSGTSLDYPKLADLQKVVSDANGVSNYSTLGFATSPTVAKVLATRQRFSNTDSPLWQGGLAAGRIADVPAYSTKNVPTASLLYGDFASLALCEFGALELSTDRSGTLFNTGKVGIRAIWMIDVLALHPESFAVVRNIT
jgi:HK97 family phage major capsid protein